MPKRTEIKWNRYGKWTALWEYEYRIQPSWRKVLYELCKCDCWTIRFVKRASLTEWKSKWCECFYKESEYRSLLSEQSKWKNIKHWLEWTAFYKKYRDIVSRCNNKNVPAYKNYWWRWIKCLRKTFEEFRDDMYKSYLEHCKQFWERETTIDRIDVNGDYCKDNCKRSTYKEQNWDNKRTLKSYTYKWVTYPNLSDLCNQLWLNFDMIWRRLSKWWTIEEAIETPKMK